MNTRKSILAVVAGFVASLYADAMADDDAKARALFDEMVREHSRVIDPDSDDIAASPGAAWLLDMASNAHFFVVGEQHATKEIPEFFTRLAPALASEDYQTVALEVGPYSTAFAESLMRSEPGALATFLSDPQNFFALAFLSIREEAALVQTFLDHSRKNAPSLWGIDQEFIASGAVAATRLEELSRNESQLLAVKAFRDALGKNAMLVGGGDPHALLTLKKAFSSRRDAQARSLIDALLLSNEIYKPFTGRGGSAYLSNVRRETLMKENFLRAFSEDVRRHGKSSKVFFKFGIYHAERGRNEIDVHSLGNFLAEWGAAQGLTTFNVQADCLSGHTLNPMSNGPTPCQSLFVTEKSALRSTLPASEIVAVDLRPFRSEMHKFGFLDTKTRELIFSFDAYLSFPVVTPASLFQQ